MEAVYPAQTPQEITSMEIGDTVLPGTDVVDDSKIRNVPVILHPQYLVDYAQDKRYMDVLRAILTGTVQTPIAELTSGSVSRYGIAQGFEGPGMLLVENNTLVVAAPDNFIWGFKTPYSYAVKTDTGIKIVENNKTVKEISYDQINNDTFPHNYLAVSYIKRWYKNHDVGDKIAIDYGISQFSDGRNMVPPSKIVDYFGEDVKDYLENYPNASPIMVYMHDYNNITASSAVSYLGSYPQYGDIARAYNARQFAKAWNNTIIPPHTTSSGKETIGFESIADPEAPGGSATHGTCPPARALRAVVWDAGFPLPTGMTGEYHAVLFGFSPSTGIKVTNTGDYPVKIIMWTTGSGGSTMIYAKLIRFEPK